MNWMENCSFVGHNIFMKMWWECVNVFDDLFLAHFIWKFPPPKINSEGSVLVTVMSSVLVYLGLLSSVVTVNNNRMARRPHSLARLSPFTHSRTTTFFRSSVFRFLVWLTSPSPGMTQERGGECVATSLRFNATRHPPSVAPLSPTAALGRWVSSPPRVLHWLARRRKKVHLFQRWNGATSRSGRLSLPPCRPAPFDRRRRLRHAKNLLHFSPLFPGIPPR